MGKGYQGCQVHLVHKDQMAFLELLEYLVPPVPLVPFLSLFLQRWLVSFLLLYLKVLLRPLHSSIPEPLLHKSLNQVMEFWICPVPTVSICRMSCTYLRSIPPL